MHEVPAEFRRVRGNRSHSDCWLQAPSRLLSALKTGGRGDYYRVSQSYCDSVSGTTDKRPCLTSGESAKSLCALISVSVRGVASRLPALMRTSGVFASFTPTLTTLAPPTAWR